jgi:deoxyribonuclease V
MLACLDASYAADRGTVACLLFAEWTDAVAAREIIRTAADVAPYESGAFYKRELPLLLHLLSTLDQIPAVIVVDGYVWLDVGGKPGLGGHLHQALGGVAVVVGVAKTSFPGTPALRVIRGTSKVPLFVSAAGMSLEEAAAHIAAMHGPYRIPTLLKRVDQLSRHGG